MNTELTTIGKWDDKFDKITRWYQDETGTLQLPVDLQLQLDRWNWIYGLMMSFSHSSDSSLIAAVLKQYPGITERTARNYLRDTKRLYGSLDAPDQAFEKVMLIASMKETLAKARKENDLKAMAAAERNLMTILGADKAVEAVENKTVINIVSFNPTLIGAEQMSIDQLDELIDKMMASDKRKAENPFDDYEDVTPTR